MYAIKQMILFMILRQCDFSYFLWTDNFQNNANKATFTLRRYVFQSYTCS